MTDLSQNSNSSKLFISGVKGMNDILPNYSANWLFLEAVLQKWLLSYGYSNIRTPIVENTSLFKRSIGEATDIVEKEMYTFLDSLNQESLTLRPEGTAGVVRAVIEHKLLYHSTRKLWYLGPMFRHERPQKGRYRQFHQLGVEALGFKDPAIDCEIILMLSDLWQQLGISNLTLEVNCLGNLAERKLHHVALVEYFSANFELLDVDSQRRLHKNPLRILDSKNPSLQALINNAPKLSDYLTDESLLHYETWKHYLQQLAIPFVENHRLVRGLDYYNLSVFEWVTDELGSQSTIAGGGRYDPLITQLGGTENFAIGFAIGIERLLLLLDKQQKLLIVPSRLLFIANFGAATQAYSFRLAVMLRQHGFQVEQNMESNKNFKQQLKYAASLNAAVTLIVGENEVQQNQVMVKFMDTQTQQLVLLSEVVKFVSNYLL